MKRIFLQSFVSSLFLLFPCLFSSAQDVTGIWKGYFITDGGEQYKLEFQVKQNNTSSITGVSYSYLDVRFYGKATMTGNLVKTENKFQIQELRTVEVKNLGGGGTCLMNYSFLYSKSGKEEFLEGTFLGKTEDRRDPKNNGVWGDCGGGKVYLRRVQNSDFYVEPFLRDKPNVSTTVKPKTNPPVVSKPPVKTNSSTAKKINTPVKNSTTRTNTGRTNTSTRSTTSTTSKTDSTKKIVISPTVKNPVAEKKNITPNVLKTRENALAQTITVNTEEVTIKLYDNGEIDDDTISVFVDKQLMLSHRRLSAVPITLKLKFDADDDEHEVVMVAENLGRIPPNTSLMVINAGDKRYQVQITSTEQKNAMVRFKYVKAAP
jgi:hypothetical protein